MLGRRTAPRSSYLASLAALAASSSNPAAASVSSSQSLLHQPDSDSLLFRNSTGCLSQVDHPVLLIWLTWDRWLVLWLRRRLLLLGRWARAAAAAARAKSLTIAAIQISYAAFAEKKVKVAGMGPLVACSNPTSGALEPLWCQCDLGRYHSIHKQ